jgi:hypothetical protein
VLVDPAATGVARKPERDERSCGEGLTAEHDSIVDDLGRASARLGEAVVDAGGECGTAEHA